MTGVSITSFAKFAASNLILTFMLMAVTITFNDLPTVVARLQDEVASMKQTQLELLQLMRESMKKDKHIPMSIEDAANYLKIPKSTIYEKLVGGDIPGCKPAKGWVLYQDELDMWVEASRINPVPLTQEEMNASILASHRRKPKNVRV